MKTFLTALLTLATFALVAQTTATWQGGAPGNETSWDVAKNWSNYQVPDELTNVIILKANSGHHAQPIITDEIKVNSIEIQAGAVLTINESGTVIIDGEYAYTDGISIYGGLLVNNGTILLKGIDENGLQNFRLIKGSGLILLDDKPLPNKALATKE